MMTSEESLLLKNRQNEFSAFYADLLPSLVDFIGRIGIQPAHEVLKTAVQFKALVSQATESFSIDSEEDRIWLVTRLGYYIGEYFVQKHSGCWYVNEILIPATLLDLLLDDSIFPVNGR
ncbi:hypothetical protein GTP58_02525 [Duganella sp. CY15W]|uniref:hypothetical protein n=1 Tax=Duganella sp. CY15W TaxID=2692172 RepID=UPI00136DA6EE|nr:hypothetical protein [Duganella sp. CY15W]MYM27194.1 hypothetical protein [Duganella sp. CY15W]